MIFAPPTPVYNLEDQRLLRAGIDRELRTLTPSSGTYLPTVTSSGGGETVTYTTRLGTWRRTGGLLWFVVDIVIATVSGGSGDLRVSIPAAAPAGPIQTLAVEIDFMAAGWTGAPMATIASAGTFAKVGEVVTGLHNAAWSKLAAGGCIRMTGTYLTA